MTEAAPVPINGIDAEAPAAPHPAQQAMFHAMDGLSGMAQANGQYGMFMNVVLQVASIMLSEISEENVDEVIGRIAAQAQMFREAREADKVAAAQQQQPTTNEGAPSNVH